MEKPWEREPNQVEYMFGGFHCLILRHPALLHLCGYVGLAPDHPLHRINLYHGMKNPMDELHCHGGITYTGNGLFGMKEDYWYVGFDCGHYQDLQPGMLLDMPDFFLFESARYRDIDYVKGEIHSLIGQIEENEKTYQKNRVRYIYNK